MDEDEDLFSGGTQEQQPTGAMALLRRLEKTRRERRSLESQMEQTMSLAASEPVPRRSREIDEASGSHSQSTVEASYTRSRDRIYKARMKRKELEDHHMDAVLESSEAQEAVAEKVGEFVRSEGPECRSAAEFMEVQRVVELGSKALHAALQNVMANYGVIKTEDIVYAVGQDPDAALARVSDVMKRFRMKAGTIPGIGGHVTGPPMLDLGLMAPPEQKEKRRAAKREKENKVTVVPEIDDTEGSRNHDDATSNAVKAMHERLRTSKNKHMSLFELVADPGNDFQKTALNTHILAILLDRQWARLVASPPEDGRSAKDAAKVYYVHAKAREDARAKQKLNEDIELGYTWVSRWDNMLLRMMREMTCDDLQFDNMSDADTDVSFSQGAAGPSPSPSPAPKNRRVQ